MIETAGGMIPFICHVFLILFGGFFGLSFAFNKNFAKNSLGFESIEARFMGRPLGFLMIGIVLMLIATLFQIGGFNSVDEILGATITSKNIFDISIAKLSLIILLTATTPPKELVGSVLKALAQAWLIEPASETPHGLACLTITTAGLLNSHTRSNAASASFILL